MEALQRRHPEYAFALAPLVTHGDRAASLPLTQIDQEGVFVKELEQAILRGDAELAVHSAKDLPTAETPGLTIAAYLPRADARDVLVTRDGLTLATLPPGARVGTGSPRRVAQLLAHRPDLQAVPIRGNVDTRLRRLGEGVVDALLLAGAGLLRLGRMDDSYEWLAIEVMLPAPGQGALAIQAVGGTPAAGLAATLDDGPTRRAVEAERAVLRGLGGGCLSAIAVHGVVEGAQLALRAAVLAEGGQRVARATARGGNDATVVADVVSLLRERGAAHLLQRTAGADALSGLRIMVTRPLEQAGAFVKALQDAGAVVVMCPVIAIQPLPVPDDVVDRIDAYDWVLFTSVNGVERVFSLLGTKRLPDSVKIGAIGPETAGRLSMYGRPADLVPDRFVAEALAEALERHDVRGRRFFVPRAQGARDVLPERLRARGAQVDVVEVYRSVPPPHLAARLHRHLRAGLDVVTFTSSSSVRNFLEALGGEPLPDGVRVACIGPITASTAREHGLRVDIIAEEYTARGLRDALVRHRVQSTSA